MPIEISTLSARGANIWRSSLVPRVLSKLEKVQWHKVLTEFSIRKFHLKIDSTIISFLIWFQKGISWLGVLGSLHCAMVSFRTPRHEFDVPLPLETHLPESIKAEARFANVGEVVDSATFVFYVYRTRH